MRSGIDTASGVAVAIFASLSDQPKTNIDFAQFQRIAHAITSSGSAAAASMGRGGGSMGSGFSGIPAGGGLNRTPSSPYGAPAVPRAGSAYPPSSSAYPPTSNPTGYPSAYPPGYQPTELGGPAAPRCGEGLGSSFSPMRSSSGAGGAGGYSPDKRAAAEEARRMARRPHAEPAAGIGSMAGGPGARRKL